MEISQKIEANQELEVAQEQALKLLQGYIWHPKQDAINLADYLPTKLEPSILIMWDLMSRAPFTFFDDGTLSDTQQFYQFTVATRLEDPEEANNLLPWLAETLQDKLNTTPEGVGWQIFEDLREV